MIYEKVQVNESWVIYVDIITTVNIYLILGYLSGICRGWYETTSQHIESLSVTIVWDNNIPDNREIANSIFIFSISSVATMIETK